MTAVEERLSSVEAALAEFIIQTNRSLHIFSREMKDFKDEMKEFKDEMRQDRKDMNKKWGDLANKMGTLVEDIMAPAIRPAIRKYFGEEIPSMAIHFERYNKSKKIKGEFDIVAVSDTTVYLVETKSSPNKEKLLEFKSSLVPRFRELFPEYNELPLVMIFSALRFDDALVELGTQEGIYMLAYREWEYMDILNFEAVQAQA